MLSLKAFGSGVTESFDALVKNAPNIAVGIASTAAVGFLVGRTPLAWQVAKVSSFVLGAAYAMEPSIFTSDLNSLAHRTSHAAGNIATSLFFPFLSVWGLQMIVTYSSTSEGERLVQNSGRRWKIF